MTSGVDGTRAAEGMSTTGSRLMLLSRETVGREEDTMAERGREGEVRAGKIIGGEKTGGEVGTEMRGGGASRGRGGGVEAGKGETQKTGLEAGGAGMKSEEKAEGDEIGTETGKPMKRGKGAERRENRREKSR